MSQLGLLAQGAQHTSKDDREVQTVLQLSLEKFGRSTIILSANYGVNFGAEASSPQEPSPIAVLRHITKAALLRNRPKLWDSDMEHDGFDDSIGWSTCRPLLRRYPVVVFASLPSVVINAGEDSVHTSLWALGWLPSGEWEVLGIWARPNDADVVSQEVLLGLRHRGAESIEVVLGAGWEGLDCSKVSVYPRARFLASAEQVLAITAMQVPPRDRAGVLEGLRVAAEAGSKDAALEGLRAFQRTELGERYTSVIRLCEESLARWDSLFLLPALLRQRLHLADRCAMEVSARLKRAVRRRGVFSDRGVALNFVADELLRIERRCDRERAAVLAVLDAAAVPSQRTASMSCLTAAS